MTLRKKMDSREARAFWESAQAVALEVAQWPSWKREDAERIHASRPKNEDEGTT